ncbi:MAG: DUF1294 domain-containing protein [Clostridia bacterium]|nr:DUF1294 domain-containing protein [Clostridia bacterium]
MDKILMIAAVAINIISFGAMGVDKWLAKAKKRRISERTLLLLAAFFGGVGAFLGMNLFRHKTKHLKFKIGIPLLILLNIVIFIAVPK